MTCTEMSEDARYVSKFPQSLKKLSSFHSPLLEQIAAGFEDSTVRVWSNDWRETAEPGSENQEIDGYALGFHLFHDSLIHSLNLC